MSSLTSACFSHPSSSVIYYYFVLRGHIVPLQQSFHKKIKQRRNCLCFALAMASDSFQRRNSHGYRSTATSRTTSWNNCEHREIKKLLSEQQLVSAWNTTFFESRGKKQISEVPFLHCAAQLFGASQGSGSGFNQSRRP